MRREFIQNLPLLYPQCLQMLPPHGFNIFPYASPIRPPRQRPISITGREHQALESQRRHYEGTTGDSGDWGKFLGTMALLGLAAIGIYGLTKAIERSERSVKVECSNCRRVFPMALPSEPVTIVQVPCPYCDIDLVVNLGPSVASIENSQKPFAEWVGRCPSCGHEERIVFVSRPPNRGEQICVVCRQCQKPFLIGHQVYEMGIDDLEI